MLDAPGSRFSHTVHLTDESIADFARYSMDENPLHSNAEYARRSSYGRVIASGPQTSALLMGVTATHFASRGSMVGLEFTFRFRAPVFAGNLSIEWLIIRCEYKQSLKGYLIDLRGRARRPDGVTAVGARGRVLVKPKDA